jgi:hypothetical protein
MTKARNLADLISDGVIGTTELADDVITPVQLSETGNYVMAQLDVNGTVTADGLTVDSGSVDTVATFESSGDAKAYIVVKDSGSSDGAFFGADGTSTIIGTGGTTERMRITSAGNVGIGTSPSYNLDVSASNAVSMIRTPDTTPPTLGLFVNSGSNGIGTISVDNGGHMTFDTGSSGAGQAERMRIDNSGNVSISSTNAEGAKLKIADTQDAVTYPLFLQNRTNTGNSAVGIRFIATGSSVSDGQFAAIRATNALGAGSTANDLEFLTCGSGGTPQVRMMLNHNGSVGIGNDSPSDGATMLSIGGDVVTTKKPTLGIADTTAGASLTLRGQSPTVFFDATSGGNGKIITDGQPLHLFDGDLDNEGYQFADFQNGKLELKSAGDCELIINADTDNLTETDNPKIKLRQDGAADHLIIGVSGSVNDGMTGVPSNGAYIHAATGGPNNLSLGTNGNVGLQIDINHAVTTPHRPYFLAKRNNNIAWGNNTLTWGTELQDNKNNFNGTRFTAPVAGVYVFHLQLTILGGTTGQDDTMYWYFKKNGSIWQTQQDNWSARLGTGGQGIELNTSATTLVTMSANDYVETSIAGIATTAGAVHSSSYFMGYLLG